jgi:two-component system, sensor histidine kinase PdtaS
VGVPEDWSLGDDANLGLQISATLVESELGGTLEVMRAPDGPGTLCEALLPLPR